MSEQCHQDISQNITKFNNYLSDNIGFTTEIDGREKKEDYIKFSFDHMYACSSDNSDKNSDRQTTGDSEVKHLRDLLMLHLDLIQQQSDEIVNKDKYIAELRLENETLKQRLERYEGRFSVQKNSPSNTNNFGTSPFSNDMTHDTGFCTDNEDSKDNLKVMGLCQEDSSYSITNSENQCNINSVYSENIYSKNIETSTSLNIKQEFLPKGSEYPNIYQDTSILNSQVDMPENHVNSTHKDERFTALRPNSRRKRLCSNSSQLSMTSVPDEKKKIGRHRKKKLKKLDRLKNCSIVSCESPYLTQAGEGLIEDSTEEIHVNRITNLEVPRWRVKVYTSCYSMEGTENLDDDVYNKRHLRLENDERRRKRWDVQRIREQRHIEKLKQRQERIGSGSKNDEHNEPLLSFWPSIEDLRYIEVTDELPVSAFGCPIPKLAPSEFKLPWLNGIVPQKKPRMRKPGIRQRNKR